MHNELIDILKNRGLYLQSTIKDLDNSPCSQNGNSAIDFLALKDKYYGERRMKSPKSVNGLYFTPDEELLFIQPMWYNQNDSSDDFLKKFSEHKMINKVEASVEILDDVVGYYGYHEDFETYLRKKNIDKIKTIILIDLPDGEYLNLRLTFGDELNIGTNNHVTDDIIIMTCEEFNTMYC